MRLCGIGFSLCPVLSLSWHSQFWLCAGGVRESPPTASFATSGAEALWHRLQPVCLSWRWKPRISIRGEQRLPARGKSASTRRASAPALRPVAQPFLAVRLWSASSPLTASFATSGDEAMCYRLQPVRLPCRWKPRISIRGSTPSGVRKERKHAKAFRVCVATPFSCQGTVSTVP